MNEPTTLWAAVWPVIAAALTPELVGAVIVTLAATHGIKVVAEWKIPRVTASARRWRGFCALTSMGVGGLAGALTWALTAASWPIIPIVAFGSGPVWRLATTLPGLKGTASVFLTATDRKYRA